MPNLKLNNMIDKISSAKISASTSPKKKARVTSGNFTASLDQINHTHNCYEAIGIDSIANLVAISELRNDFESEQVNYDASAGALDTLEDYTKNLLLQQRDIKTLESAYNKLKNLSGSKNPDLESAIECIKLRILLEKAKISYK